MGQQEYDNFKRLIREWLDSHPDEYAAFVEEMNDKEFKGFVKVFKVATTLVPKYKEATRRRIGDDKISDFEELENVLLDSDLAKKIVNEFHHSKRRSIIPAMLAWLYYGWWNRERNWPKEKVLPDYTNGLFPTWSGSSSRRASAAA